MCTHSLKKPLTSSTAPWTACDCVVHVDNILSRVPLFRFGAFLADRVLSGVDNTAGILKYAVLVWTTCCAVAHITLVTALHVRCCTVLQYWESPRTTTRHSQQYHCALFPIVALLPEEPAVLLGRNPQYSVLTHIIV